LRQLCARLFDPWIEFFAVDHAIAVSVDQSVDDSLRLFDLLHQAPLMS